MKLGSGICPVPDLLDAGVNVALGTDGMCSNDGNDMYATIKTAALLHKLWEIDYERWLGADAAWAMATANGAAAAGDRDGLGRIEPGRRADLVLLDLDTLPFTPLNDPLRQVVLGSTTLAVDSVLVGGRWVMRSGRLTGNRRGRRSSPRAARPAPRSSAATTTPSSSAVSCSPASAPAGSRRCEPTSASSASSALAEPPLPPALSFSGDPPPAPDAVEATR